MSKETTPTPSGYATHDTYFASRIKQGGRWVYSVDLAIPQVVSTLSRPDPDVVLEGNRRINASRAKKFGQYIREKPNYVCPSLLMRAPEGEFEFRDVQEVEGGGSFGILAIPKHSRASLKIVDGQHRTLGLHMLWDGIEIELSAARGHLAEAKRTGDKDLQREFERRVKDLVNERNRLAEERIRVDIIIVDDPKDYKQVFVDIAENAKGVSGAVKARFDSTKVAHRALDEVLKHPLLVGRINEQTDSLGKDSPYLIGAKHAADIIRSVQVGAKGRISRRHEDELNETTVARQASAYLDILVDSFPLLLEVQEGRMDPAELRRTSALGSTTMLRVLAGVYHRLTGVGVDGDTLVKPSMSKDDTVEFFKKLAPHMEIPVEPGSLLFMSGVFLEGASAPSARQGDVGKFENTLVEWATGGLPKVA